MGFNWIRFAYAGTLAMGLFVYGDKQMFFRTTKIDGIEKYTFV